MADLVAVGIVFALIAVAVVLIQLANSRHAGLPPAWRRGHRRPQ